MLSPIFGMMISTSPRSASAFFGGGALAGAALPSASFTSGSAMAALLPGASGATVCSGASAGSGGAAASSDGGAASPSVSMTASTAPTCTASFSAKRVSTSTPETGEGTSVSTLSVVTSSSISSACTASPGFFSQFRMMPSVMLSPSSGI